MTSLAENIKYFRLMHKLSAKQLAEKIDVSPNTISNWEKDVGSPKMHYIQQLCNVFGITPNQLFGYETSMDLTTWMEGNKKILIEIENIQKQKADLDSRLRMLMDMLNQGS